MAQKTRHSHKKQATPRRWLVLSAWSPELSELRRLLGSKAKTSTVTEICGVGLVEATLGAALAIAREQPDAVLFVGTAGRYKPRLAFLELGDVVAARDLHLWSEEVRRGRAYFPAPLPATLMTTPALLRRAMALGLPEANVACPLGINTHPPRNVGPDVENLEAFAVGRAAARQGLPFLAILGISNVVGHSAHAQWKKHASAAAAAACRAAYALIAESRRPFRRTARGQ